MGCDLQRPVPGLDLVQACRAASGRFTIILQPVCGEPGAPLPIAARFGTPWLPPRRHSRRNSSPAVRRRSERRAGLLRSRRVSDRPSTLIMAALLWLTKEAGLIKSDKFQLSCEPSVRGCNQRRGRPVLWSGYTALAQLTVGQVAAVEVAPLDHGSPLPGLGGGHLGRGADRRLPGIHPPGPGCVKANCNWFKEHSGEYPTCLGQAPAENEPH